MIEACPHLADGHLEALAAAASILEWPLPRERDEAVCHEAVRAVDALLVRVARCQGALDVAIGEGLDALAIGDRALRLGCASIGDYARESSGSTRAPRRRWRGWPASCAAVRSCGRRSGRAR